MPPRPRLRKGATVSQPQTLAELKSVCILLWQRELLYDWRFPANQFVLAPSLLRMTTRDFFATEPLPSLSLCNILSDEGMYLSLMNMLGLCQVCVLHMYNMLLKILPHCIISKCSVSPGFANQIMPILFSYATMAA
jgi:hypothetical protein